jgi:hypothetical protein
MNLHEYIRKTVKECLNEEDNKSSKLEDYYNNINNYNKNMLIKVKNNPNFVFLMGNELDYNECGTRNKCETNVYDFIKEKLENGYDYYYPVGGFLFEGESFFPIDHWWVYNKKTNAHIEITPLGGVSKPLCYAGVINYDINDKIMKSNKVWDIDFFRLGNVYYDYFR